MPVSDCCAMGRRHIERDSFGTIIIPLYLEVGASGSTPKYLAPVFCPWCGSWVGQHPLASEAAPDTKHNRNARAKLLTEDPPCR